VQYSFHFGQVVPYLPDLLSGAFVSLQIAFICFWCGMAIGLVWAIALEFGGRPLRGLARAYVSFFTNTPGLVQIYFIYYALPDAGLLLSSYQAVVLGITLNAGGYLTLILRGGFASVHSSEIDAAIALGFSRTQQILYVVLPHIARVLFPPIGNKFVLMVLGTAVAGVFGVEDLMGRTINANAESYRTIELLTMTACIYVALTVCATLALTGIGMALFGKRVRFET